MSDPIPFGVEEKSIRDVAAAALQQILNTLKQPYAPPPTPKPGDAGEPSPFLGGILCGPPGGATRPEVAEAIQILDCLGRIRPHTDYSQILGPDTGNLVKALITKSMRGEEWRGDADPDEGEDDD